MKTFYTFFSVQKFILFTLLLTNNFGFSQVTDWTKNWSTNINIQKHNFQPGFGHILAGDFIGTADFDLGPGTQNSTSTNNAFFLLKLDTAGDFEWVKTMESSVVDLNMKIGDLKINGQDEIYLTGNSLSIDLDPSVSIAQFNSTSSQSPTFLAKYSTIGDFLWHQSVNLPYAENTLELDPNGNAFLLANDYAGAINISVGTDIVTTIGQSNESVLAKYSSTGTGLWVKKIRSNSPTNPFNYSKARTLTIANDGSAFIAGEFKDSIDFDPSTNGDFYLNGFSQATNLNYNSFFILKLDLNGDFVFAKKLTDTHDSGYSKDITLGAQGDVFIVGKTSIGITSIQPHNFIQSFDSNGNSLWTKQIIDPNVDFEHLILDSNDNIYITGNFSSSVLQLDSINNLATINNPNTSGASGFLVRYDQFGNFVWSNQEFDSLNGTAVGQTNFTDIGIDANGTVYVLNSPSSGLLKVTQDSCAFNFNIAVDSVTQMNCSQFGMVAVSINGGTPPYLYLWSIGDTIDTLFTQFPGTYTMNVTDQNGCNSNVLAVTLNNPTNNPGFDLVSTMQTSSLVPGLPLVLDVQFQNLGCTPVSGSGYIVLDTIANFVSSSITPDAISGDTLFWNLSNLLYPSINFHTSLLLLTDSLAIIGTPAQYILNVNPQLNDLDATNNVFVANLIAQTSYDPNDISVYPKGKCDEGYVGPNEKLKYTVRFQNTGTSPAINISILDSLDLDLNGYSLRILGSSHEMYHQINNNVVTFVFDDINLPDSNSNEPASHGYVVFEVTPPLNLVDGIEIENKVGIYFDYNVPVYTNTVLNTIYTGDLANIVCANLALKKNNLLTKLLLYPNPVQENLLIGNAEIFDKNAMVQISDLNGRIVHKNRLENGMVKIQHLNDGLYFIKISDGNRIGTSRFIKH